MDLEQPLSEEEQKELHRYLVGFWDRLQEQDKDAATEELPVRSLAELDGYLTAIATGPESLETLEWLSGVFGGVLPDWTASEEQYYSSLMLRHVHGLDATLREAPEEFEPMLSEITEGSHPVFQAAPWCLGYMRVVNANREAWVAVLGEMNHDQHPLTSVNALGSDMVFEIPRMEDESDFAPGQVGEALMGVLPSDVRRMYSLFREGQKQAEGGPGSSLDQGESTFPEGDVAPLTFDEQDGVDDFLGSFAPEPGEAEEQGVEQALPIVSFSELDGFLTALVAGPEQFVPSTWLPIIFGGEMPTWESQDQASWFMDCVMRHMNAIVQVLMDAPEEYEPVFAVTGEQGHERVLAEPWCAGFFRGMSMASDKWTALLGEPEHPDHPLIPVFYFATNLSETLREADEEAGNDPEMTRWNMLERLPRDISKIYDISAEQHSPMAGFGAPGGSSVKPVETVRHEGPRVGRNDPCPCGSGRKYKKCCLQ